MELISREQAIDALRGYLVGKRCPDDGTLTCRLIENEVINKLPTIQPELSPNLAEVGTDCISRERAIGCLRSGQICGDFCRKAIEQLPPAQPERIKGHWIKISPANIYECSECGKSVMTNDICAYDFCHGCGADMREATT